MINFIQNNSFIIILSVIAVVALILIFAFIKMGNKNDAQLKKIRKAKKEAQAAKVEQAIKKEPPKFQPATKPSSNNPWTDSYIKKRRKLECFFETDIDEDDDEEKKKKKVKKKSKKVANSKFNNTFTFVRTLKRCDMPNYSIKKEESELLGRMEFVKSSKTVSKLTKRKEMLKMPEQKPVEIVIPQQQPIQQTPVQPEPEKKLSHFEAKRARNAQYFDKNRRLSKYISEGDLDSLFSSHISDAYMNIDMDRHLKLDYKFNKRLFDRAARTLSYGEIKITDDKNLSEKAYRKSWLKQRRREERMSIINDGNDYVPDFLDDEIMMDEMHDDYIDEYYNEDLEGNSIRAGVDLAPKNLLAVDSILYRKNNYNRRARRSNTNSRNTTKR